jgi:hypothetical protein
VSGRFGLRSSPGGIATPAFGPEPVVLRTAGPTLVREQGGDAAYLAIEGSSLAELAAFAGTDLEASFDAGPDTPDPGDPAAPLSLSPQSVGQLADWWALGTRVLDRLVAGLPPDCEPATVQIWPEHFDAATNVAIGSAGRVNLGFSPGDSWSEEPYAYIGPWGSERPGDQAFWNAPFGAFITAGEVASAPADHLCREFFETGLGYLKGEGP